MGAGSMPPCLGREFRNGVALGEDWIPPAGEVFEGELDGVEAEVAEDCHQKIVRCHAA